MGNGIVEGGGEAKMRKNPPRSHRRDVGNRGDMARKGKIRRQERLGSVDVDTEGLKNSNKAGREAQGTRSLEENCRESMSPLSRLIRTFRNKHNRSPLSCLHTRAPPLFGSLYPISLHLNLSSPSAQRKMYGCCSTLCPMACGGLFV